MSDILAQFNLDEGKLASAGFLYPKTVKGRVAHIDADFLAYQCACPTNDQLTGIRPMPTRTDREEKARYWVEHLTKAAGASGYVCHITPSGSTKGGRRDQAVQLEYQGNRKDREAPEYLDEVRAYIVRELNGVPHLYQEADDGLAQAAYESDMNVICSADKDLMMVPGNHLNMTVVDKRAEVMYFDHDTIGGLTWDGKLRGYGPAWFFAQCLMGDTADNIQGAPGVPNTVLDKISAPMSVQKLETQMLSGKTAASRLSAQRKLEERRATYQLCGGAKAYAILNRCTSVKDMFDAVRGVFQALEYQCGYEFKHWKTGERVTPTQALLGDMQTLWMRRSEDPNDVISWLKENTR